GVAATVFAVVGAGFSEVEVWATTGSEVVEVVGAGVGAGRSWVVEVVRPGPSVEAVEVVAARSEAPLVGARVVEIPPPGVPPSAFAATPTGRLLAPHAPRSSTRAPVSAIPRRPTRPGWSSRERFTIYPS